LVKNFLGALALMVVCGTGFGQVVVAPAGAPQTAEAKRMMLWPEGAPGAQGTEAEDKPTLTIYLPKVPNATRTGVVVAPGGGYTHLSMVKEGSDIATWLNERGVAAFVLQYRLGPKYHHPVEMEDAQRAIRMVRASAAEYGIAEDHLGMWGFSAGGHLAATAGTHFDAGVAGAVDVVERKSSRPDFLILAYPVITFEEAGVHSGSRLYLLGEHPDPTLMQSLSAELQVTRETPPTFLFATTDDGTVPVMNSVMFYGALVRAGIPVEMHLFQHGRHGAGLALENPELSTWTELLAKWMRERGYMAAAAAH
jgi:acetyl esterase/lipase